MKIQLIGGPFDGKWHEIHPNTEHDSSIFVFAHIRAIDPFDPLLGTAEYVRHLYMRHIWSTGLVGEKRFSVWAHSSLSEAEIMERILSNYRPETRVNKEDGE